MGKRTRGRGALKLQLLQSLLCFYAVCHAGTIYLRFARAALRMIPGGRVNNPDTYTENIQSVNIAALETPGPSCNMFLGATSISAECPADALGTLMTRQLIRVYAGYRRYSLCFTMYHT